MAQGPEAKVKARIRDLLRAKNIWFCTPIGATYGAGGVPDFICCWCGLFLAIEAKAPRKENTVRPLQQMQIDAIRAAGGLAVVVSDIEQLRSLIDYYAREHKEISDARLVR